MGQGRRSEVAAHEVYTHGGGEGMGSQLWAGWHSAGEDGSAWLGVSGRGRAAVVVTRGCRGSRGSSVAVV